MAILRFMIWNLMVLIRRPIQLVIRVFMFVSLGATIGSIVMIFFGTGSAQFNENVPFLAKLLAPIVLAGSYFVWSGISYLYDSALFRLTPEGRSLTLFD